MGINATGDVLRPLCRLNPRITASLMEGILADRA